jgi:hypothetical protein
VSEPTEETGLAHWSIKIPYLGVLWVVGLENVSQQKLRVLVHDGPGEGITLIRPKVVVLLPPAADQFLKVGARINIFVVGRQAVQDLRRGMDARRRQA